jgi:hypothetical protein
VALFNLETCLPFKDEFADAELVRRRSFRVNCLFASKIWAGPFDLPPIKGASQILWQCNLTTRISDSHVSPLSQLFQHDTDQ